MSQRLVDAFLSRRRIALLGVSTIASDPTRKTFRALVATGHEVVPIRPGVDEIEGERAYAHLDDVPGVLEGALIMMSRRTSELAIEECAAVGIVQLWVVTPHGLSFDSRRFCASHSIEVVTTPTAMSHVQSNLYRSAIRWLATRN